MIKRHILKHLLKIARFFPAITILGPRQSGKTTLAKIAFPKLPYASLENPDIRASASEDPRSFLAKYPKGAIIDEIQRVPSLLSYLQEILDNSKHNGRFVLTGSHQPEIHAKISQSLAGRTGILRLLPLSIAELSNFGIELDRDEYMLKGFMPAVYSKKIPPNLFYSNYYSTYVERDVRQLAQLNNQKSFELFIKLLAGRIGQVVNLNSMAGDIGISSVTLASWLSILEASYIIFRLPCYFNNFGKRLIKSPKIYFTDVGLAAYLLGINSAEQISRDPLMGGLFENMVVAEALKQRYNSGKEAELYYFRDQKGFEIDLILNEGQSIIPIEIKASRTYNASLADNIRKFISFSNSAKNSAVIYSGKENGKINNVNFVNFKNTGNIRPSF
ncbi:ATPase AAA [Fibrobacteria bacterium R8-3-H12]